MVYSRKQRVREMRRLFIGFLGCYSEGLEYRIGVDRIVPIAYHPTEAFTPLNPVDTVFWLPGVRRLCYEG